MSKMTKCQSCGMPIEDGLYCEHCTDEQGNLQTFAERFERMTQWLMRREGVASRSLAERQVLETMAAMPAWRDHPELKRRLG